MHDEQWVSGSPILNAWEQGYFSTGQVMVVTPTTNVLRAVTEIVTLHTVDMGVARVTGSRRSTSCYTTDNISPWYYLRVQLLYHAKLYVECNRTAWACINSGNQALPFLSSWEQRYLNVTLCTL